MVDPIDITFGFFDLLIPLKDVFVAFLSLIGQDKIAAMFNAVIDLLISIIELAKSIYEYVDALRDAEKIQYHMKESFKKQRILNCEARYNTAKSALNTLNIINEMDNNKNQYELDLSKNDEKKLYSDIKENCYLFPSNCIKLVGDNGKPYHEGFLDSKESAALLRIIKTGPISDIAVSTADQYDEEFTRNDYFSIETEGRYNKIFACRSCRVDQIITDIEVKPKESLTTEDYRRKVVHISYENSLVYDVVKLTEDKPDKIDIPFIKDFSIYQGTKVNKSYGTLTYNYDENKFLNIHVNYQYDQSFIQNIQLVDRKEQLKDLLWKFRNRHCIDDRIFELDECVNLNLFNNYNLLRFRSSLRRLKSKKSRDIEKIEAANENMKVGFGEICKKSAYIVSYSLMQNVIMRNENGIYSKTNPSCYLWLSQVGDLTTQIGNRQVWFNQMWMDSSRSSTLLLDSNGELIVFYGRMRVWSSGKKADGTKQPYRLELNNECYPVIYDRDNNLIWIGDRGKRRPDQDNIGGLT